MGTEEQATTAMALVAARRGILAADESNGTMSQRLEAEVAAGGTNPAAAAARILTAFRQKNGEK